MDTNKDIQIQSPIDGQQLNLRFICQFYEKIEVEPLTKSMFSQIKFWYDTTQNISGFHQMYITYQGVGSKEIAVFTGFYLNPVQKVNFDFLSKISKNAQFYYN